MFEVVGDEFGEIAPHGAPDGMGRAFAVGGGGVEGIGSVDDGDGVFAVFAAEASFGLFLEVAAIAGIPEGGVGDAEPFGDTLGILAGGADVDGPTIAVEGVELDEDFVLDGLVRVVGVIEIHRVLGGDDPVGGGDAAIGGADGDAPGARGTGEGFGAAAGEAAVKFLWIGEDLFAQLQPGVLDGDFEIVS